MRPKQSLTESNDCTNSTRNRKTFLNGDAESRVFEVPTTTYRPKSTRKPGHGAISIAHSSTGTRNKPSRSLKASLSSNNLHRKRSQHKTPKWGDRSVQAGKQKSPILPRLSRVFERSPHAQLPKKSLSDHGIHRQGAHYSGKNAPSTRQTVVRRHASEQSKGRVNRTLSPSMISVLSELTNGTNSSSECSNTTMTRRSYAFSSGSISWSSRSAKQQRNKNGRSIINGKFKPSMTNNTSKESLDVFKFLQEDSVDSSDDEHQDSDSCLSSNSDWSEWNNVQLNEGNSKTVRPVFSPEPLPHRLWVDQDLHDSGPSLQSSPESPCKHPMDQKESNSTVGLKFNYGTYPLKENILEEVEHDRLLQSDDPSSFCQTTGRPPTNDLACPAKEPSSLKGEDERPKKTRLIRSQANVGAKPGSETLHRSTKARQHYRSFESLHQKLLLHLQDELIELERQLEILDEKMSKSLALTDDGSGAWAYHRFLASQLKYQRTELLGRIFMLTQQYRKQLNYL